MTTFLLDSSVIIASLTPGHPHREAAQSTLEAIASQRVQAHLTTESLVELLHLCTWNQDRRTGQHLMDSLSVLFPQPVPTSTTVLRRAAALVQHQPRLSLRAALLAAGAESVGCRDIISIDENIGLVAGLRRWEPHQVLDGQRSKAR